MPICVFNGFLLCIEDKFRPKAKKCKKGKLESSDSETAAGGNFTCLFYESCCKVITNFKYFNLFKTNIV